MSNERKKERSLVIDMMKGIGIILMMYYHLSSDLRPLIFSFHMPLFFIISGFLSKEIDSISSFLTHTKKNLSRLFKPYLVTIIILIFISFLHFLADGSPDSIILNLQRLCWAGADLKNTKYGLITVGPLWFLVALFWTKEIFALLQLLLNGFSSIIYKSWILLAICSLLSFLAISIFPNAGPIPFSLFQGVGALVFFALGSLIKNKAMPGWLIIVSIISWPFAIIWGSIDMMFCQLKIFPLSVIGAFGGTYLVFLFCNYLQKRIESFAPKFAFLTQCLAWIGKYSIVILCMHSIDYLSGTFIQLANALPISLGEWSLLWFRFSLAIVFTFIVTKIPLLRKVYY